MIKNGKNTPLNANSGTLPNMSATLTQWFQKMTFSRLVKTIVNFENVETKQSFSAMGVIQPMSAQQIAMKPEGQTSWMWYTIHADPSLILMPGEIITYLTTDYRVMGRTNFEIYGYLQYDVVQEARP